MALLVRRQASQRFLVFTWQPWVYFGHKQEMKTVWYERGVSQCDVSLLQCYNRTNVYKRCVIVLTGCIFLRYIAVCLFFSVP